MLSSITPLGQRGRGGSWRVAVSAFWVGSILSGVVLYSLLGFSGGMIGLTTGLDWAPLALMGTALLLDGLAIRPAGPRRQVNENWLGSYRDWVVGFGFGTQLGIGIATYVTAWAVWALLASAVFVGLPGAAGMGLAFGIGRSVLLFRTAGLETAGDLTRSMRRFANFESRARALTYAGYASVLIAGVLYGA